MPRIQGYIATAATTEAKVNGTAYTEPTSGAQRSIKSSSAADAAAGTGARTIKITYYTLVAGVVAGPFTETLTLNGVTAVPTVNTDICLIEKIEVLTAGSGGVPAGAITLYTDNAGAGTAICSVAAGDRRTYLAHHYVPTGTRCFLTDLVLVSGEVPTVLSLFAFRTLDYAVAAAAEQDQGICFAVKGAQGYQVIAPSPLLAANPLPRIIPGGNRIQFFITPGAATAATSKVDAGYYEAP